MAALTPREYEWRWKYKVRQIFNLANPLNAVGNRVALTNDQIDAYVKENDLVTADLAANRNITPQGLGKHVSDLRTNLRATRGQLGQAQADPGPLGEAAILDPIYPPNRPDPQQIAASRARIAAGAPPAGIPPQQPQQQPRAPQVTQKPIGITPIVQINPQNIQPNDNITLAANPPSIYEAVQDANIPALVREIADPNYNPEQTFSVTIADPGFAPPAGVQQPVYPLTKNLTVLQYAALKGLKGIVRYLIRNSKSDLSKKIDGLSMVNAVKTYRKNDSDKDEIRYIFDIVEAAVRDASDDFTSGVSKDANYGNVLTGQINQQLSKTIYNKQYDELTNPSPLPTTAPRTTSSLVEDAKKNGKEDGERGYPKNPDYATKPPQEQEAYGKEYDKGFAKYSGERDGKLNEPDNLSKLTSQFSAYYLAGPHKDEVDKIYNDAYNANRSKTVDISKEAGYVGTYPASDALLSGNYFGFGSELNKIIGFDMSDKISTFDTDTSYKEGFAEFVKQVNQLLGQAKYAGYIDGNKKNAKYTSLGKIVVNGKQYAVDFGKLNTQIKTQIVDASGNTTANPDFTEATRILNLLRGARDSPRITFNVMIDIFENILTPNAVNSTTNPKIKEILQPILDRQVRTPAAAPTGLLQPLLQDVASIESVNSKSQLYDLLKIKLSIIPKYEEVQVKEIPRGVKPDDPSLTVDVNVPRRLQKIYDLEFDRGSRDALRTKGGTRRRSRKADRFTKKNRSSKK